MVNLNIYRFMLLNKANEQQVLSFYNEEDDLFDTMNEFCEFIHKNIRAYKDNQGKDRTFTLRDCQNKDLDNRIISGYFDSAYTGERGRVNDGKSNRKKCDILKKDLVSRDFFFLIHVPKNSKFGFLIFQKKENHGVKTIFENDFNIFMRSKGVSNFYLELKQAPPRYFIKNYLDHGKLKEIRLIENQSKSGFIALDSKFGKEERIFKLNAKSNEGGDLKPFLVGLFNTFSSPFERIPFLDNGDFDEIVFVLGYNGSSKTFYIKNKEKIRANLDVTNLVEFEDGEPTTESLVRISLDIIKVAS